MYRLSAALCSIAIMIAAPGCEKQLEPSKRALAEAAVEIPEDIRAPKPPGCPTLVVLGHFDGLSRYDRDFDKPLDDVISELIAGVVASEDLAEISHSSRSLNECGVHVLHLKKIKQDAASPSKNRRQVIFNILVENPGVDSRVYDVATKFTCWTDAPETWRHIGACPAE